MLCASESDIIGEDSLRTRGPTSPIPIDLLTYNLISVSAFDILLKLHWNIIIFSNTC